MTDSKIHESQLQNPLGRKLEDLEREQREEIDLAFAIAYNVLDPNQETLLGRLGYLERADERRLARALIAVNAERVRLAALLETEPTETPE